MDIQIILEQLNQISSLEEYNDIVNRYYDKKSIADKIKEHDTALLKDNKIYLITKITQKYVTITYFNEETNELSEERITKLAVEDYTIIKLKDTDEETVVNKTEEITNTPFLSKETIERNNQKLHIKTLLSNLKTGSITKFIGNKVYDNELKRNTYSIYEIFPCKVLWVGLDYGVVKIVNLNDISKTYYCDVEDLM